MFKSIFLFLSIFAFSAIVYANGENDDSQINWISIEEAEKLTKENPKKIFVDVYTDWCGWCKRMDANTFSHPYIIDYINENFYAVKLNAEQNEPIVFRGVEYVNENPGGRRSSHNFARALLQGRMSYPSVAFFDEQLNLITAIPGYRDAKAFEPILVFFNEDIFTDQPNLDEFISNFEGNID
ncbi:MAG: thioredoxin family protein [Bacteroidales bacterium]